MTTDYAAWGWPQGKGLQGLKLIRKPLPRPAAHELLVANTAIALNPVDWKMIEWGPDDWSDGHVPGVDGAGVIVAAGSAVPMRPGTRVAYHQALNRDGSFAEYSLIDARCAIALPDALDDALAAALPCPGLTALQALDKLPQGGTEDVLVVGAGGAVGNLLVQMAVQQGFRVWASASPAHHEALLSAGVTGVLDYHRQGWQNELQSRLGLRRLHALFDTVSGEHAAGLAPLLGYNGHLVCIQDRQETAPLPAFSTALSLHEVALNSVHAHGSESDWRAYQRNGTALLKQVAEGQLKPSALLPFSFAELPEKLRSLKDGERVGKWVARLQNA
ncbi:zinc-binding dehydrogenase [Pseudomonas sp. Fl5BN2]|nr:zinc-binding dehydrogenase [Pseudomonas sp. Fl5BN2]